MSNTSNTSNYDKVKEFHLVFAHPVTTVIDPNIFTTNPKLVDLRLKLIQEECNELEAARRDNNMIETRDALGDILYVVLGAGLALGFDFSDENGDNIKFDTSHYDDISEMLKNTFINDLAAVAFTKIRSSVTKLQESINKQNISELEDTLVELIFNTYWMAKVLDINLDADFDLIHKSNMTKVCANEQQAIDTVEFNKDTYPGSTYKKSETGDYWVVYSATGKVVKSKYYQPVQLN